MTRTQIKESIDRFIQFIESGSKSSESKEEDLVKLLDALSYASHFVSYTFDKSDYPEFKEEDQFLVRQRIEKLFPEFGYYNIPESVRESIAETPVIVGDAIDDLLDIYLELKEVHWCWENTSVDDALWHFDNNYKYHWEDHIRSLQVYLYDIRYK